MESAISTINIFTADRHYSPDNALESVHENLRVLLRAGDHVQHYVGRELLEL
ncbi:MAG: hypothetical protein HW418_3734, partial [Anaerolineales bacterium]|nr:hypothetical protein [Anaerolineales bacterium]